MRLPGARVDADRTERDFDVLVERQGDLRRRLRRDAVLGRVGALQDGVGPRRGGGRDRGRAPRAPARRRAEPGALLSCARHITARTRPFLRCGPVPGVAGARRSVVPCADGVVIRIATVAGAADRRCSGSPRPPRRRTRSPDPGRPTTAAASSRSRRRYPGSARGSSTSATSSSSRTAPRPRSPCSATRASRTCASARAASSRTCTRRRRTSTERARAEPFPSASTPLPTAVPRVEEDLERSHAHAGTTTASTGCRRSRRRRSRSRPARFHHLSQQNIVFLLQRAAGRRSRSRSTGFPGRAVCRGSRRSSSCSRSVCSRAAVPKWWRLLAVLVALVVLSDIAHAIAFEIPRPGGQPRRRSSSSSAGASCRSRCGSPRCRPSIALLRRRVEALYGVVFVGLLVALIGGATDLSALWKSQLPDAGPGVADARSRSSSRSASAAGSSSARSSACCAAARPRRRRRPRTVALAPRLGSLRRRARPDRARARRRRGARGRAPRARGRGPRPCADAFADGPVAFVVTDRANRWSCGRSAGDGAPDDLRAARGPGRAAPRPRSARRSR